MWYLVFIPLGFWYLEVLRNVDVRSTKYEEKAVPSTKPTAPGKSTQSTLGNIPNTKKPKVSHTTYFLKLYKVLSTKPTVPRKPTQGTLGNIPNTKKPKVSHTTYFVRLYEVPSTKPTV